MSVAAYRFRLLTLGDFDRVYSIEDMRKIIKAWRGGYTFASQCSECHSVLDFSTVNFHVCCGKLVFTPTSEYMIRSLAVPTPHIPIFSNYLKTKLLQHEMFAEYMAQDFLVLVDPLYWRLETTFAYDIALRFLADPAKCMSDPQFETRISKLFLRLQNTPLMQCSMSHRTQGKHSLYRTIALAKRAKLTGRAMIVPAPFLKPNEVILPQCMSQYKGLWVLLNRMPTLWPMSMVALRIRDVWDSDCIGVPCELAFPLNLDYDGDELNCHIVLTPHSQQECETILNCEANMQSFCNQKKLYPSQDAIIAYYVCKLPALYQKYPSLPQFLQLVLELEGSQACFNYCDLFRQYYLHVLEHEVSFSISFQEFQFLEKVAKQVGGSFDAFETYLKTVPHEEGCLEVQVKSGAKGTFYHLFQLVGSVGPQKQTHGNFETIHSSFLKGLMPREYLLHAKSGHDALIESSIGVWKPGYEYFKIVNSTQNIMVTYDGKLMNGDRIISDDALSQVHPTEVISNVTFDYIFDKYFPPTGERG